MRAYSLDIRQRVVEAVTTGASPEEVAALFVISRATVYRYLARQRTEGTLACKTSPGRPRAIPVEQEAALQEQLGAQPDAILAEHCARWEAAQGQGVSSATMCRAIARLGWTRTKRRSMPVSRTR